MCAVKLGWTVILSPRERFVPFRAATVNPSLFFPWIYSQFAFFLGISYDFFHHLSIESVLFFFTLQDARGFNGFLASMLAVHLLRTRQLAPTMSSYQILRMILKTLGKRITSKRMGVVWTVTFSLDLLLCPCACVYVCHLLCRSVQQRPTGRREACLCTAVTIR